LNQASGLSGLDSIALVHEAIPRIDFEEVGLSSRCLGKPSPTPFFVAAMTAGHRDAPALNERLARAAAKRGWSMGVGSQRRELQREQAGVDHWSRIRANAPGLRLYANIGLSQLSRASLDDLNRIVSDSGAVALAVHANALQEGLQPEGTPQFRGAEEALAQLCQRATFPVILKETGCGWSTRTLLRVDAFGLAAIDISGLGGTHWGRIEGARAGEAEGRTGRRLKRAAAVFGDWGISTLDSVMNARKAHLKSELWASGGVRTGLDAAKLVALGAVQVGFAKPALEAALQGEDALDEWMEQIEFEYRLALFCAGARNAMDWEDREAAWVWKNRDR
jgi:isopentenyl-diphosphate delta-isomerase